jgi:hypothetical protein
MAARAAVAAAEPEGFGEDTNGDGIGLAMWRIGLVLSSRLAGEIFWPGQSSCDTWPNRWKGNESHYPALARHLRIVDSPIVLRGVTPFILLD